MMGYAVKLSSDSLSLKSLRSEASVKNLHPPPRTGNKPSHVAAVLDAIKGARRGDFLSTDHLSIAAVEVIPPWP